MLHISIKPEVIFHIAGFPVTNSLLSSWIVLVLITLLGLYFTFNINNKSSTFVFFLRFVLQKLHETFVAIPGKVGEQVVPVIISLFLFILLSNWLGLLPGVGSITIKQETFHKEPVTSDHSADEETVVAEAHPEESEHPKEEEHAVATPLLRGSTADLNMTIALALLAFGMIQFYGFKVLGLDYLKKFVNISSPINFFIGILEAVSEFSKVLSFSFRLFGNIFAGEVLISVIAFLIPVLASFPFLFLEVFVGLIQALVFAMLTAVFIKSATAAHH